MAKACKWNPPPAGSKKRQAIPRSAFLIPSERKYPFKEKKNGEWVTSECGLAAARSRAAGQHEDAVFKKATTKLNAIRKKKGKEPFKKTIQKSK